ncbi:MAG: TatD family hydrolase [Chloroflexi bacterium]|nr:TatD family hydrolase [Chloroflexota bacterium]
MSGLIDTHAHLDSDEYAHDLESVIERAGQAGIQDIVTVGVDLPTSRKAIGIAERDRAAIAGLRELCRHPRVVAVGEIGLDFYRNLSPRKAQLAAFRQQLELASQMGLPVIIHDRAAHSDVMSMLAEWLPQPQANTSGPAKPVGVLHCFSGDLAMAERVVEMGFFISLAGPVTFANARATRDMAQKIPLDRLLLETDCPFLAPEPHRGQRNEPAYVRYVSDQVAKLRNLSPAIVREQTTINAKLLFDFNHS